MDYAEGKVLNIAIEEEMQKSYIDYAMSVIVSRALPDVRDGLKPVQRRILYAMHELGMAADKPHKKCARIVGEVLGKYHPHGDAAVYDAMVRLAQEFNTRYLLVDGHGNFGSMDGDAAAAMRYTEARLTRLAMEMLADIDKETVDFSPNFDDSLEEPQVLPACFPQLLANGSEGIAVGMATKIPPHNLTELINGLLKMIDDPEVTSESLMEVIEGPDFPTGALILGKEGIREAYTTGRGVVIMRAVARIETAPGGRNRIVVSELPYQVNKAKLVERIAELVREKKVEGIADLRDESDRSVKVVIDLRRDANPNVLLNQLYKHTPMQQSFGIIMLALVDRQPRVLNLREMLHYYLEHQKEILVRRTRFELARAEARAHILEGLRIALDHLDRVIALIRASHTVDEAREGLVREFALSEKQAQAILDMRLQRLTGLEREKVEEEYAELVKTIEYLRAVLASERLVYGIIRKELEDIRARYGDQRRTRILPNAEELDIEDLIAEEDVVITMTHLGYIKRLPVSAYRSQRRGGRGITGVSTREEDFVENLFVTTTHHYLFFFTNTGKTHRIKVHEIPEASRHAKGTAAVNLVALEPGEKITAVIPVASLSADYLFFATARGVVKKTSLDQFDNIRRTGLIAIHLDRGDELVSVRLTDGNAEVMLVTRSGMCIRFPEEQVRPMGRPSRGVAGIALAPGDEVVAADVVQPGTDLVVVTDRGFGKRTPVDEYRVQARGGRGIKAMQLTARTGQVAGARLVGEDNELMLISSEGTIIRQPVAGIARLHRATQGVTLMRLDEGDSVVAIARMIGREDDE
ncbi:MAG: DNA gyrase subunit A [Bacillota bacterium]